MGCPTYPILIWALNWVLDMNTHFKVFSSYNILQYLCDFIHVLIFVIVSKCRKSPKLTNIVIVVWSFLNTCTFGKLASIQVRFKHNHMSLKYMCPIKISKQTRSTHLLMFVKQIVLPKLSLFGFKNKSHVDRLISRSMTSTTRRWWGWIYLSQVCWH